MDPVSLIFILNGLVNLALEISANYLPQEGTPAEEQAKVEAIIAKLHAVADAVQAWQPIPEDKA